MKEQSFGIMMDCSRNAVMKPQKVKEFAKLISEMGYNMLQLYTEETYEIEGEPFFGHLRGRYSKEELKSIDQYCQEVGVELVPCIQVLAHLARLTQWEAYTPLFDVNDILLVGEDKVYDLIDRMFATLEECFTSRRVNVGMDEAHMLGRGKYQDLHGYEDRIGILSRHLKMVTEIAKKHGFTIMMWSDMFIRLHNQGEYYGKDIKVPQETIDQVPEGVELIYWDYYSKEKEHYDHMLRTHSDFHNPIAFAGGLWTWTGYTPNLRFTWDATEAAMRSIAEHPVDTIFFTLWGDGGKDCSYFNLLPMLYMAARMRDGEFNRQKVAAEFEEKYGYTMDEFLNLELANITKEEPSHFHNPNKYLLYNDPFLGIYDFSVTDDLTDRYAKAVETLQKSINGRAYDYLFELQKSLLDVLQYKADLGVRLRKSYQSGDRATLEEIQKKDFPAILDRLPVFYENFRKLWLLENKPFGLEIQEQRFGGLYYRILSCSRRMEAYLSGEIAQIEELEEQALAKYQGMEGEGLCVNDWKSLVSVSEV